MELTKGIARICRTCFLLLAETKQGYQRSMNMSVRLFFCLISVAYAGTVSANAQESGISCSIVDAELVCANSKKDGKSILQAMAASKSLATIMGAQETNKLYADGDQREAFRLSLEANRAAMTRYADRALRQYKRRKISADDYEAIRAQYQKGMVTYNEGLELYRRGTWLSLVKPHQDG